MPKVFLGLAALLLLGGCGLSGASLEQRAVAYYNHQAGHSPKLARSSFLTPAYREELKKAGTLKDYDDFLKSSAPPNKRYPDATEDDIATAEQDGFAITIANPELGPLFYNQQPLRWVKVGRSWYLYTGADTEVGHYGVFPETLAPPKYEKPQAEETEEAEAGEEPDTAEESGADGAQSGQ